MSDDDLFADSDDTAELISNSKPAAKPKKLGGGGGSTKRKRNEGAAKKVPDADDNDDDDDDDDDDKGLFDSDSDDDNEDKKPAAKKAKAEKKPMSKRERMEALQKKKRAEQQPAVSEIPKEKRKPKASSSDNKGGEGGGNQSDSEDSYNSRDFQLTEDDRNFIDTEGDDADAINELYQEQHFDDARGEAEEYNEGGKKKKGGRGGSGGGGRRSEDRLANDPDSDNPIMQAVNRMKKKKREAKKLSEMEEEAKEFMDRMERAAEEDELAVRERRPATKKLAMLNEVTDTFTKKEYTRVLLDLDVLSICRRWIQPLPNGHLGNVTIRQRLIESIANMTGELGITPNDLKKSEFGKVVMNLYMHKSETPAMKRRLKDLIEQWSRPIFQKSGNMRDLERVHAVRGEGGLSKISRMQQKVQQEVNSANAASEAAANSKGSTFDSMIKSGKAKSKSGLNRVRIPYSKGFQFTVRPTGRAPAQTPDKAGGGRGQQARGNLTKRMMEKSRTVAKNQRSANISVEGRANKG